MNQIFVGRPTDGVQETEMNRVSVVLLFTEILHLLLTDSILTSLAASSSPVFLTRRPLG